MRHAKDALKRELLAQLDTQLATARAAHASAAEGAFHEEAKAENDKDTRGLEQSYLARGQAARVAELENGIVAVTAMTIAPSSRVALGALVTAEEDDRERLLYIAPAGGGLALAGGSITVVTPASPVGRALLGKVVDDDAEVGRRTLTIIAIA
jgi:transcription elongation GreA/GreB family factor